MAFNLNGIAVKNNDIQLFIQRLGELISGRSLVAYIPGEDKVSIVDVFSIKVLENGIYIYLSGNLEIKEEINSKLSYLFGEVLLFDYNETAMLFNLQYYKNGMLIMSLFERERDFVSKIGSFKDGVNTDSLIIEIFTKITGVDLFCLEDYDDEFYRIANI
jgi:hypothetical protein